MLVKVEELTREELTQITHARNLAAIAKKQLAALEGNIVLTHGMTDLKDHYTQFDGKFILFIETIGEDNLRRVKEIEVWQRSRPRPH